MTLSNTKRSYFGTLLVLVATFDDSHAWVSFRTATATTPTPTPTPTPTTNHQRLDRITNIHRTIDSSSISHCHNNRNLLSNGGGHFHRRGKVVLLFSSLSVPPERKWFDSNENDEDRRFDNNRNRTLAMKQQLLPKATQIEILKVDDPSGGHGTRQQPQQRIQQQRKVQGRRQRQNQHYEKANKELVEDAKKHFCPFTSYLFELKSLIKDRMDVANRLNDEVKRMEGRYYGLVEEEYLPKNHLPTPRMDRFTYRGIIIRPTEQVYQLVCAAYCRASLGTIGAQLMEDVIARYEQFNPGEQASTKMMGYAMKAWIAAQDMDRAEYWLRRIEGRYQKSRQRTNIPGDAIYGPFIKGLLADTRQSHARKVADMSIEIINKMNDWYETTKETFCHPGQDIYSVAIKCQTRGYTGMDALERIEGLFRQLLGSYKYEKHPTLKPTAETALPLFVAAANCYGLEITKAAKIAEGILHEFEQLYIETGDIDFCPNTLMYQYILSMYMRIHRQARFDDYAEKVGVLLKSMKETGVTVEAYIILGALNRRLQAADILIPDDPFKDPVKTRFYFDLVLDTFKMFHGDNPIASPNTSTYEIFLRACNRLPRGDVRAKLATKAFALCRKNGLVTMKVCRLLHESSPQWALSELNTSEEGMIQNLFMIPDSWEKNVRKRRKGDNERGQEKSLVIAWAVEGF
jgi:hypothetical protein